MESALEVLSRAATMVNTNSDNRLTINKELPTTKWRRDRRIRLSTEYHHNSHDSVGSVKPLGESNQSNSISGDNSMETFSMEIPLDMSVGSSKPPPPYRDPLPGSTFSTMSRPSVITQAPKREITSNQENKESPKKPTVMPIDMSPTTTDSISMVDPVIDEHFRRSLGADYIHLFGKNADPTRSTSSLPIANVNKSPQQTSPIQLDSKSANRRTKDANQSDDNCSSVSNGDNDKGKTEDVEMSVDDHFAKALGATWKQLQQNKSSAPPSETELEPDREMDHEVESVEDSKPKDDRQSSPKDDVTNGNNLKSQCQR